MKLRLKESDIKIDKKYNLTDLQELIISNRLTDKSNIEEILNGNLELVKDLDSLKDVGKAGKLINQHMKDGSYIVNVVDYDCDGLNSGAVLDKCFRNQLEYKNVKTIPNKRKYGNGINNTILEQVLIEHNRKPIGLFITADHGSSDRKNIKVLRDHGIDVIVTDHHQIPKDNYPKDANVFINNQRDDSEYSKYVSGCFVAFLVMLATYREKHSSVDISKFDDIIPHVAVTTISDVMDLDLALNRHMVNKGTRLINSLKYPLWSILKKTLQITTLIDYHEISFTIAPLINTANRMNCEEIAFTMLTSNDNDVIYESIKKLMRISIHKRKVQKELLGNAMNQVKYSNNKHSAVVNLESDIAVNGIISAQLGSYFGVPSVCFIRGDNDVIKGSGRANIPRLSILDIFKHIQQEDETIIKKFGGHEGAAGCDIYKDKFELFKELFDKKAKELINKLPDTNIVYYDIKYDSNHLSPAIVRELDYIGPYGKSWSKPAILSSFRVKRIMNLGSLLKLNLANTNGGTFEAIYFFNRLDGITKDNCYELLRDKKVDIIYNPTFNNFIAVDFQLNIQNIILEKEGV